MMLVPRKRFDLFDDFFDDEIFSRKQPSLMKTDIREKKDKYIIDIDLPGILKIEVPKKDEEPKQEETKQIQIK